MKIGIISDSHDNLTNIDSAINFFKKNKIKHLIHAGDLCFIDSLDHILKTFNGKVYLVEGNGDDQVEKFKQIAESNKNFFFYTNVGEVIINKQSIAFTHKPEITEKLALSDKYNLIIYGHTHKPWEKVIKTDSKTVRIINPGTLAGLFNRATLAVYDTKKQQADLILLEKI